MTYIGRVLATHFDDMDAELPLISQITVNYTSGLLPMLVGVVLGVLSLVGLMLVSRSEKVSWLLPFLLTVSFVVVLLQLAFVSFGMAVPFEKILSLMSE